MDRDIMIEQVLEYFMDNYVGQINEIEEEFKQNFMIEEIDQSGNNINTIEEIER